MTDQMYANSAKAIFESSDKIAFSPSSSMLKHVADYDETTLRTAMGKLGPALKTFADSVDQDHPELGEVLKGLFADDALSQQISECIAVAKFAVDEKLEKAQKLLSRATLTKIPSSLRSFDSPQKNQALIRLLSDRKLRDEVRSVKTSRAIQLTHFSQKGSVAWANQPSDFSYYLRFSTEHEKDIKEIERKGKSYSELGCIALADKMSEAVASLSEHMTDTYCGFHRIKMTDAAVILSKEHKFEFSPPRSTSAAKNSIYTKQGEFMEYYYAGREGFREYAKPPRMLYYAPVASPIGELWDHAPQEIKAAVDHLEAFPEAGRKPIFDHYVAIVPGIAYPTKPNNIDKDNETYAFTDPQVGVKNFSSQEECRSELNKAMINNNIVRPILLGERDGNCYFICYWPNSKKTK